MRTNRHRASLTVLWTGSFAFTLIAALYLRWIVGTGPGASGKLFELILGQYAPYVGAVIGFYFSSHASGRPESKVQTIPYRLAMGVSGLWNLVMVGFVLQICIDSDRAVEAMTDLQSVIPKLAWLVAPVMGIFFGKRSGATE
jgi:hypothetical protein